MVSELRNPSNNIKMHQSNIRYNKYNDITHVKYPVNRNDSNISNDKGIKNTTQEGMTSSAISIDYDNDTYTSNITSNNNSPSIPTLKKNYQKIDNTSYVNNITNNNTAGSITSSLMPSEDPVADGTNSGNYTSNIDDNDEVFTLTMKL